MQHFSDAPPPFFHRGPSPFARLALFGLLSLALLFTDSRYGYLEGIRSIVAIALHPLQRMVQIPGETLAWVAMYFTSQRELSEEVAALKQQVLAQGPATQGYGLLRDENAALRALLAIHARFANAATAAEVLYTGRDPFSKKIFLNRGTDAGIKAGEAVIDQFGVIGQVTRAFPQMAEVTLVTDKDHAVPVKVERSGVRGVFFGAGAGRMPELRFMASSSDVRPGDKLYTSGLDGIYPADLAVAQVLSVERETGQMFSRILCTPTAGVDRTGYVLVLRQGEAQLPRPEEPVEADLPRKGTRAKGRRSG